ncbi:lamin tail domain-containing protein [Chryseobacterium koreense]|uniref:lamin tail domain-containing protein n=1 Tax=Chryseobacterium koreense TaxID=232216 RepID=UPI0026F0D0DE|nr:lamin tail domain-containing protein [Chryseobacterium koreense]
MDLRSILFVLLIFASAPFFSQIAITEVYYDTPYNEKLDYTLQGSQESYPVRYHHRGEFIELYNYSDKDINLKDWYVSDYSGNYKLPDKILKSGEFVVVVYSPLIVDTTPFTDLFPTTVGKEDKIINQDKILLRNKREVVKVGYLVGGVKPIPLGSMGWSFSSEPTSNYVANAWTIPNICYTVKSLNLSGLPQYPNQTNTYSEATPNPLESSFKPPIQNYETLMLDVLVQNYGFLDWSENVANLIENKCPISIDNIQQTPTGTFNSGEKCFTFDIAGNNTTSSDCISSPTNPNGNEYTYDELEAIKNSIAIYPNPAISNNGYVVYISWSGPAIDKIYNLQVYNSGAQLVYGFLPTIGIGSVSFSLQGQLPGAFVANFTLNTGQVISKNILKL